MRQLQGDSALEDTILRQLFLQRMPINVQAILAGSRDNIPIDQMAEIADKIIEVNPIYTPVLAHATYAKSDQVQTTPQSPPDEFAQLRKQVQELSVQVTNLTRQVTKLRGNRSNRSFSRTGSRSQSPAPNRNANNDSTLCWFHQTYAANAQKCRQPCTFTTNNEQPKDQASN